MSELCYILEYLPSFNDLNMITDINIFKNPIKPLWEDEENLAGGKYIIKVKRVVGQRLFEKLVVNFMDCDYVNGVVASIRKQQVMLSVWVRYVPADKKKYVQSIRDVLELGYDALIEFKDNDESLKDNSSFRNTAVFGKIEEEALTKSITGIRITSDDKTPPKVIERGVLNKHIENNRKQHLVHEPIVVKNETKTAEPFYSSVHEKVPKKEKILIEEKFSKLPPKNDRRQNSTFDESKILSEGQQIKSSHIFVKGNKGFFKVNPNINPKRKTFKSDSAIKKDLMQQEKNIRNLKSTVNDTYKDDGVKGSEARTDNNINN